MFIRLICLTPHALFVCVWEVTEQLISICSHKILASAKAIKAKIRKVFENAHSYSFSFPPIQKVKLIDTILHTLTPLGVKKSLLSDMNIPSREHPFLPILLEELPGNNYDTAPYSLISQNIL